MVPQRGRPSCGRGRGRATSNEKIVWQILDAKIEEKFQNVSWKIQESFGSKQTGSKDEKKSEGKKKMFSIEKTILKIVQQ